MVQRIQILASSIVPTNVGEDLVKLITCSDVLVLCPDPTHEGRGSGYASLISWASRSAEAL